MTRSFHYESWMASKVFGLLATLLLLVIVAILFYLRREPAPRYRSLTARATPLGAITSE